MKNLISALILCCCCCSINAFAEPGNGNGNGDDGVYAHECSQVDLTRGKVNVCHVPGNENQANEDKAHTICVDASAVKNGKTYNGHEPGEHGGDTLGICPPDATPTSTPTPVTPTATPTPGNTPEGTPTVTPTPTITPTASPTPRKVTICHLTPNDKDLKAVDIEVSENALEAHLAHGDRVGACVFDCAGAPFGQALNDACGVCGGDGSSCTGCQGTVDSCGVCNGQNNTCLDCAGVPNGTSKPDLCGVCNGNNSCVDCLGIPGGPNKPDLCGVCGGLNTCLDCANVPNGGTIVDQCGVCGGQGGDLVSIKIDKKKLIKLADALFIKKTVPYFAGAARCDKSFGKLANKGTEAARKTHTEIVEAIKRLQTEFRLCPGTCIRDINKGLLLQIIKLAKLQYKFAAQAQYAGRKACKNIDPGIAKTKPILTNLHSVVNKCPNKACK